MGLVDKLLPQYREKVSRYNNLILEMRYFRDQSRLARMREDTKQNEISALKAEIDALHTQMLDPEK